MSPDDLNAEAGHLTMEQAYRAMHRFVQDYFERGGRKGDELAQFLSYSEPEQWGPRKDNPIGAGDPAAWDDWTKAVQKVEAKDG